jgi:hypothetical protein
MATTPTAKATVTVEKEIPLPHMPPKPTGAVVEAPQVNVADSTKAEQDAGKAAVTSNQERLKAEQEAGASVIGRLSRG